MCAASHPARRLGGPDTVRSVLADAVKARASRFLKNLRQAAKHPDDDPVHDLRVSVRRLAAALLATAETARSRPAEDVLALLKTLMRPLGKLRDAQVQLGLLNALPNTDGKALRAYLGFLEAREARFRAKSRKAMKKLARAEIRKGCKDVRAGLRDPSTVKRSAAASASGLFARCYAAVCAHWVRAHRVTALDEADLKALHKMRLAVKRLRYTVEVLQPLLPQMGKRRLKMLGRLQTRLGDIHDLDVIAHNISAFYAPDISPPVRRVLDRFARNRKANFEAFRRAFLKFEKDPYWPGRPAPKALRPRARRSRAAQGER